MRSVGFAPWMTYLHGQTVHTPHTDLAPSLPHHAKGLLSCTAKNPSPLSLSPPSTSRLIGTLRYSHAGLPKQHTRPPPSVSRAHRAKGLLSCTAKKPSALSVSPSTSSLTGALKSRSKLTYGLSGSRVNVKL